nr:peptidogalycan biosysnthesis protein [Paracoccus sp. Z118]
MSAIPASDWDCCGTAGHPLLQHRHLRILEECGLAAPEAGFTPHHLILREAGGATGGAVIGAAPAWLKTNSAGELGVDLGLPLAHERAAGPYYPKLQVEVPMVPNPGPRLLVRPGADAPRVRAALLTALREAARRAGASSVQIAYMTGADQRAAVAAGFVPAEGNVFVWRDRGKADFTEFAGAMTQNGRTRVRKERQRAAALGLRFDRLTGPRITPDLAPRMFAFYRATYDRYGTTPALNLAYFEAAFREMADVIHLSVALQGEEWAAALMSVAGAPRLHAQYWGLAAPQEGLLFEMYYREMEYALTRRLEEIDFGGTGHHKTLRGIGIEPTCHALWFRDETFTPLAARACARRRADAAAEREAEAQKLPFPDKAPDMDGSDEAGTGMAGTGATLWKAPSGKVASEKAPSEKAPSDKSPSSMAPSGAVASEKEPSGTVASEKTPSGSAPSGKTRPAAALPDTAQPEVVT